MLPPHPPPLPPTTVAVESTAVAQLMTVAVDKKIKKKPRRLVVWSLAPSIFNIKAPQGLAHCLHWMKLSENEVYEVY